MTNKTQPRCCWIHSTVKIWKLRSRNLVLNITMRIESNAYFTHQNAFTVPDSNIWRINITMKKDLALPLKLCLKYFSNLTRVHHAKCQGEWSTTRNQSCQEKYQYLRYAGDTTLMEESEELKSLLMKVKEEGSEQAGLKLYIQKTKIMASGPITSLQIDGETVETVRDFFSLSSKITAYGDCRHESK